MRSRTMGDVVKRGLMNSDYINDRQREVISFEVLSSLKHKIKDDISMLNVVTDRSLMLYL